MRITGHFFESWCLTCKDAYICIMSWEEFEDAKGIIRIRMSKKNRRHNSQKKIKKDKQRTTKHTYETKDRVSRTPLKPVVNPWGSGRVISSCFTSGTRRINLVTNPVLSHEWGKDREVLTTSETYPWSFVIQIFHKDQPSHGDDNKTFRSDRFNITRRNPGFGSFLVSSNPPSRKSW